MERKEAIEVIKKNWPDSSFTRLRDALEESEDEKIRKQIKAFIKSRGSQITQSKTDAWLEKQGEQKHAEWSEEDEQLINEVAECLRKYARKVQGGNSKVYVLSLADRIESLRPQSQWKPSDEQMKALQESIGIV